MDVGAVIFCLTSQMSHAGSWRAACKTTNHISPFHFEDAFGSTRRDRSQRWLWRLVRLLGVGTLGRHRERPYYGSLNAASTSSRGCSLRRPRTPGALNLRRDVGPTPRSGQGEGKYPSFADDVCLGALNHRTRFAHAATEPHCDWYNAER